MKKNPLFINRNSKARKGFTLVEVLVAIAIFSIVVTIAVGGFVRELHSQREVASLISAQSNVSLVLEQMAREIRTGYLFCHDAGVDTPSSSCDDALGNPCTVVNNLQNGPTWTCGALNFYNADSQDVSYTLNNGSLQEAMGGSPQSITGDSISVKYLAFKLFGAIEGDHWTPRITVAIGITPSSTDPVVSGDVLNLETTISARTIDCTSAGGVLDC